VSVEEALEQLTHALARRLDEWRHRGFDTVRQAWLAKAGPLGMEVDVKLSEGVVRGRFAGIDRAGALLLDADAGLRRVVSGELLGRTD
jgi:BirA family biotin operon repressor/biotin-[acetyl-CoA-carboxylase] ligase